jgi:quercetin dioxygenase-like cupin family protein
MDTDSTLAPVVRGTDEGEQRWFYGGGVHTWKATSEETGGAFLLFEDRMDKGKVTPLHTHPVDETVYVLEGDILVHLDGQEYRVGAGGMVVAPREVPHAFRVMLDRTRVLCFQTPGGGDAFYLDASEPIGPDGTFAETVDFDRIRASAEKNGGVTLLGPPPFAD